MRFRIKDKVRYLRNDASIPLVKNEIYTVKGAYCFQRDEYLHLLEVKNENGDPFLADGFELVKRGEPMSPETKQVLTDLATALYKYADEERTLASDNLDDTRKFLEHSSAAGGFMRAVYYITDELLSPAEQEEERKNENDKQ